MTFSQNLERGVKIYFAGPLFSSGERSFNPGLAERLETLDFEVFLPQRDGIERDRPPYDTLPAEEKRRLLFETDRDEVLKADVFLWLYMCFKGIAGF